ncbi:MAG: pyridoxal-dependent decarboxylase [Actinomycetota bacterium]
MPGRDLFGLPERWGGVLTTGATGANVVGLAAARRWWGEQHGRDVDVDGLASLPPVPVFASGFVHPSDTKALAILGVGRGSIRRCSRDAAGRLDLAQLEQGLRDLDGAPSIVIGSAGEVNAGEFDPLAAMADLTERYGAWLHVDGAFGLFAQLSPATSHLTEGIVRADSVTADGHKWLNVPYDCGFAFVRDPALLLGTFTLFAAYLAAAEERPSYGLRGPESSRRARSLTVWATLRAYGRQGYRKLIERHVALARHLADDLERLADVPLNIVCFRYRPPGMQDGAELDALNRRIGEVAIEDGRVYFGTTTYGGRVAFRPAILNWRTSEADVELVAHVVREIGARLRAG